MTWVTPVDKNNEKNHDFYPQFYKHYGMENIPLYGLLGVFH